jgi:hypothetical protein
VRIPLLVCLLAVVASPDVAGAQAPTVSSAPLSVTPVSKGALAPFTGLLVPEARLFVLLSIEIEVRELRARLRAAERAGELIERAYMLRLEQATAPLPWYESTSFNRWLGFGLGLLTTGVVVWGVVELVDRIP